MMEGQHTDEEQIKKSGPQPHSEEVRHSKPSGLKGVFSGIMSLSSGKREKIFTKIILAIAVVWIVVWATNRGYPFWPGLAGVLTIPLLFLALVVDNVYAE